MIFNFLKENCFILNCKRCETHYKKFFKCKMDNAIYRGKIEDIISSLTKEDLETVLENISTNSIFILSEIAGNKEKFVADEMKLQFLKYIC